MSHRLKKASKNVGASFRKSRDWLIFWPTIVIGNALLQVVLWLVVMVLLRAISEAPMTDYQKRVAMVIF